MQIEQIRLECLRISARGGQTTDEHIAAARKLEEYVTGQRPDQVAPKRGPGRPRKHPLLADNPAGPA